MNRCFFVLLAVALAAISCAKVKPVSLAELQELTADSRAASAESESPVSFAEAVRYRSLAEDAFERGDEEQADRLAELGVIQVKIALAGADEAAARKRLEGAMGARLAAAEELERTEAEIGALEAERERRAIRAHLEGVVDATRLRAAAAEDVWQDKLDGEAKRKLEDARRAIGRQMMSRILVWRDILSAYIKADLIQDRQAAIVDSEIKAAQLAFGKLDLALTQQHIESAGLEVRRLLDAAWESRADERETRTKDIGDLLSRAGFETSEEEYGQVILVEIPLSKNGAVSRRGVEALRDLGSALKQLDRTALLVITSLGESREDKAETLSLKLAEAAAEAISHAGLPQGSIAERACGSAAPVKGLKSERFNVAVVPIPLPR